MRPVASEVRRRRARHGGVPGSLVRATDHAGDNLRRVALIDQKARKRVAQVMQADVGETSAAADAIPGTEDADKMRWEDIGGRRVTVACRNFFRTFDQATAPVCGTCG